jgi:single-stranded-DNA-specific exonuclease
MRWHERAFDAQVAARLAAEAGLPRLVAQLLAARGVATAEEARRFLSPALEHLHSPYLLSGMSAAVERLQAAIERREPILIYGDYDVDGTTAVVILKTVIELCGGQAAFHVPHRLRDGYGMKGEVIEQAAAEGVKLVISVDVGIRAFAAAQTAQRAGVDLIVTDHHLPDRGEGLPAALAVVNPNQAGCEYPNKALCGAGVAFKMAQALLQRGGRERLVSSFAKMAALATIADAVPLTGENRVLAALGLEGLLRPVNPGLRALLEVAGLDGSRPLAASDVAFRLAPRLNAAGRMDVAAEVVELFSVRDPARAREIAGRLNALNAERQTAEQRVVAEIEQRLQDDAALREAWCVVVDGEGWHRGVIGIAATRVVERTRRPALVIARDGEQAHGSGRSIARFHLLEALESCSHLFTRFGGHAHAVGFALESGRIPELRAALEQQARARLREEDFVPALAYDAELGSLDELTPELFQALARLAPFGMGNPEPVLVARAARLLSPPRVLKEKHVKLRVGQVNGSGRVSRAWDALGWRMAERLSQAGLAQGDVVDIAFRLEENLHPEFGGMQLVLCDVRRTAEAAVSTRSAKADPSSLRSSG